MSANLNINAGPTFDIEPEDSKEFVTGISKPIDIDIIRRYWDQGWPRELLLHMLIWKIEVVKKDKSGNVQILNSIVNQPSSWKEFRVFQETLRILRPHLRIAKSTSSGKFVGPVLDANRAGNSRLLAALVNTKKSAKDQLQLVKVVLCRAPKAPINSARYKAVSDCKKPNVAMGPEKFRLRAQPSASFVFCMAYGVEQNADQRTSPSSGFECANNPVHRRKEFAQATILSIQMSPKGEFTERAKNELIRTLKEIIIESKCALNEYKNRHERIEKCANRITKDLSTGKIETSDKSVSIPSGISLVFHIRSVNGMIYYLGQVVRAKEKDGNTVRIMRGIRASLAKREKKAVGKELASALSKIKANAEPLLVVKKGLISPAETALSVRHGSNVYSVPITERRSLQTMTLVLQLLGLNRSAEKFEGTRTVNVIQP